jgi:hypothetical protein
MFAYSLNLFGLFVCFELGQSLIYMVQMLQIQLNIISLWKLLPYVNDNGHDN